MNSALWTRAESGIVVLNPVEAPVAVYTSNVTVPGEANPLRGTRS
jgi:hypothetical protein